MKKSIKILAFTLFGFTALGVASLITANIQEVNAGMQLIVPQEYTIQEEYNYGETLTVPEPSSVRIKTGTVETVAVEAILLLPDGTAKSEGSYTLDQTGIYELTYYNANGASATETFTVYKNSYAVSGVASVSYEEDLLGMAGKNGIDVCLKDGTSFTYNQTINLNDYEGQALEVCKIFPMFREDTNASPSASTISIKLVDSYDSTKFVEFYVWCGIGGQYMYAGAGASTQVLTGLENNPNRPQNMTDEYEGNMYMIHRPSRYQSNAVWGSGLRSLRNADMIAHDGITLMWDFSDHKIKAKNGTAYTFVTDLDSAEIYDTNVLDLSSFFTTGEVYMNIEAYNYTTNEFRFGIESIFGQSGDALQNARLIDKDAPEIVVEVEPTVGNTIYLQKGKAVTLPKIESVFDTNYYGNARIEVYRNYGKAGQALLNVEDGVFIPEMLGNYTAVYTAIDSYGNEGKSFLEMTVLDETNIVYEACDLSKLVAAKSNLIPRLKVSGLNKEVGVRVVVTTPDGLEIEVEESGSEGYEFVPEYAGDYTVTYVFKDNVYEEKYSYSVACVDENSAIFKNPFTFPVSFMKGATYTIPSVYAYTAGEGEFNKNEATVSVSLDGGETYQELSKAQMQAYKVEDSQTLRFKATYGEHFVESALYSVVDVGFGKTTLEKDYLRYMQGNYSSSTLIKEGAEYVFDDDAKLQFINAISSEKFKLSFSVQANSAKNIVIILRDVRQPDRNYVVYTYVMVSESSVTLNAKQYENGKLVLDKTIPTKDKGLYGAYELSYSSLGLTSNDVVLGGVKSFETDNALMEIQVLGASEGCKVTLSKLNNQNFSTTITESKPQIVYKESDGVQEINSIYTLSPCYASSVMCSVLEKDVKLTVYAPNGEIASTVNGISLESVTANQEYSIKLLQTGQYRVVYEVSCLGSTRKSGTATLRDDDYYIVNVSEGIAPEIKFKDGSNSQTTIALKVGSSHIVKEFSVTDNLTASENIKVYTMILDKGFTLEENGYNVTSYVFRNAGEFIVYVLAYDELGNSSAAYYNVVVS